MLISIDAMDFFNESKGLVHYANLYH